MADPELTRRAIGKLTFALARISPHNKADALEATRSLLDMRPNDLPTKDLRRRFQSMRDRVVPQGTNSLIESPGLISSHADWLTKEIRELLIETLLHQKLTGRYLQSICPICSRERRSEVLASHVDRWEHAEYTDLWNVEILRILRCLACGQFYSHKEQIEYLTDDPLVPVDASDWTTGGMPSLRSEVTHWAWMPWNLHAGALKSKPKQSVRRPLPPWTRNLDDGLLKSLLNESYSALNANLLSLPAIGMRAVLDRAMVLHGAAPEDSFAKRLSMLEREGLIIARDRETLHVLIDAGSAATHSRWRPKRQELAAIFDVMEDFLKRAFVIRKRVAQLRDAVPSKPKRAQTGTVVSIDTKPRRDK